MSRGKRYTSNSLSREKIYYILGVCALTVLLIFIFALSGYKSKKDADARIAQMEESGGSDATMVSSTEDKTINEEVIVQAGYTKYQSDKMKIIDLMSKEQLSKFQDEASLIITHGGVGSIVSSIEKGKKVIAVPRKHEYGEHVNNHQEEIVKDFNSKGYIIGIENVEDLKQAIIKVKDFKPKKYKPNNQKMLEILENFIENI